MLFQRGTLLAILVLAVAAIAAVEPSRARQGAQEVSDPYIIERCYTAARFENDGTSERDFSVQVRVLTDAGAQQFRGIILGYSAAQQKVDVRSVTVRKAGGAATNALTADAVKQVPSPQVRGAPAYSDWKETHIAVPSLQAGDVLEYRVVSSVVSPAAPGQFWYQYNFVRDAMVVDERLELNLPLGRAFSIKSPGFDRAAGKESRPAPPQRDFVFTTASENGRTVLRWRHTHTQRSSATIPQAAEDQRARTPDLLLTSLENWDAVAHWFTALESNRTEPNAAIKAKTHELVHAGATNVEKTRALSDYVSKKIRSIDLASDVGRLQPHSAAEVLANGYGDSEDKHALLTAMLAAAGIRAAAVLTDDTGTLDPDLPSPSQFNHVITVVPESGQFIWMDSAAELAPFRYLPASLRDKSALLVSFNGAGKIVETPADPPFLFDAAC